jgi:O-antigen/teichoic acid export membrane protein
MVLAQFIAFVLQFASTVVLARYLTPYEVGVSAVAFAVVAVVSVFQQLGLPSLIVREEVLTEEISITAFTVNAAFTALLSLVIAATSFAGAAFFRDGGVQRVLLVLAVTPLFGVFAFLPSANLERAGRFKEMALIGTVGGILNAAATIVFAVRGYSYMSVAYAQVMSSAVYALLMVIVGREHVRHRLGLTAWRRISAFGFQMLAISGINTVAQRMSEVMMGRLLGLSALGMFNRANGLNATLWGNIHNVLSRVMLVDFADLHRRGAPLRDRYLRTVSIVTVTLWPAFGGLAVISEPFIVLVYGDRWRPAAPLFVMLAVSSMILVAITMTWEIFTATGRLAIQTRIEFVKAAFGTGVFVAGCLISLEAAAAARVVDALFAFFIYRPHLNRMTGTSTSDYWPIYGRSLLATGLAVAPAGLAVHSAGPDDVPLPVLAFAILIGVLLWLGGLFAMKHPLASEIQAIARARFPRLITR